ncbi:SLC2A8 [Lepeophtheirus salmonis]|uniref:SLC2A8 n=1 Tax=Lepeophtheirus salmonis TaxID=72036 RepID=A0A7R8H799_LEPSM|nr:SLC2A8 [Lepeophtheirus salmonis]CAF2914203.1 SLC2A8 [Lepeophtheirus salmonis]
MRNMKNLITMENALALFTYKHAPASSYIQTLFLRIVEFRVQINQIMDIPSNSDSKGTKKDLYKNVPRTESPYKSTTVPLPVRQTSVLDTAEHSTSYSKKKQTLATGIITLGCLLNGSSIGYTGIAIPSLMNGTNIYKNPLNLNQQDISWITSLLPLGCFFGGLMSIYVMEKLASNMQMICTGRFFCGVGFGLELSVATVYVVEIASADMRRVLKHFVQFMGTLGVLFSFITGGLFLDWNTLALINLIFLAPFALGLTFLPESPHWLIHKGYEYQASESLEWLRGRDDAAIDREIEKIKRHVMLRQKENSAGIMLLKGSIKPFIVSLFIMFFMIFSAQNMIIFYLSTILETAGSSIKPTSGVIICGLVLLLSCVVSLVVISKTKRKWVMVLSMFLTAVFHFILGGCMHFHENAKGPYYNGTIGKHLFMVAYNSSATGEIIYTHEHLTMNDTVAFGSGWLPLFCITSIIFIGNIGYGTLTWAVTSEIMPPKCRNTCNSVLLSMAFFCGFFITKTFVDLVESVNESGAFWIYGGITALGGLFTLIFIPETKGVPFEEIRNFYYKNPSAYKQPKKTHIVDNATPLETIA